DGAVFYGVDGAATGATGGTEIHSPMMGAPPGAEAGRDVEVTLHGHGDHVCSFHAKAPHQTVRGRGLVVRRAARGQGYWEAPTRSGRCAPGRTGTSRRRG